MKKILFTLFLLSFSVVFSQNAGPIIQDYGKTFTIENPDLLLKKDTLYKVIFDVYTDVEKSSEINRSIETVARFLNMHAQQGVPLENMKVVLVLHGKATKNALNDVGFEKKFGHKNPNSELLAALKKSNVSTFVCGQSFTARGYKRDDLSSNVKISLSALTALVEYQSKGYQIINFN
ncbi:intracellular sulfur oxidation DsrE/DsrF family protein [Tenacibaculum adriaticum]|uniref:Intracellular sulfur oxidation DsrE/DsrF family protein n=1 Tax=Tenacibaculum adriaticum TaxID=413713 RepID=A0A5S5DT17_9FLAO|nr:DsrE family protein [Tenacibaculum adriaticum]TYP99073.1 intracellular sulfur oxidation DsrE/DsrF family protein [Tenacibaculum adriaticum]